MGNKALISREREKLNMERRVFRGEIDYKSFFQNIRGDLLISGQGAADRAMVADLVCEYAARKDMPVIVLTGHEYLPRDLREKQEKNAVDGIMTSYPEERNYHPMYGMSAGQIVNIIRVTAEEMGYRTGMDQILTYASAVINVVMKKYPVSLSAITALLKNDDDFISALAIELDLSNIIADDIRGNHEAGITLRRVMERLEKIFEDVSLPGADTGYSFQSGVMGNTAVMVFYQISRDQSVMNQYLKEELFSVSRRVPRIRLVLDEAAFEESDELESLIFQMSRQGKLELIVVSSNIKAMLYDTPLNFRNVCLFQHDNPIVTEQLSRELFGTYQYHYPVPVAGKPPAVFFTLMNDIHWQIAAEERPRIRAEDLYGVTGLFGKSADFLAVRTTANDNIYLIPQDYFLRAAGKKRTFLTRKETGQ